MTRRYPSTYETPVWNLVKWLIITFIIGFAIGDVVDLFDMVRRALFGA